MNPISFESEGIFYRGNLEIIEERDKGNALFIRVTFPDQGVTVYADYDIKTGNLTRLPGTTDPLPGIFPYFVNNLRDAIESDINRV